MKMKMNNLKLNGIQAHMKVSNIIMKDENGKIIKRDKDGKKE